jgi:hypothetical protein
VAGHAVTSGLSARRPGLTGISGSLSGLEWLAGSVRVGDAQLITSLAGEIDHLVIVHSALLARRQNDVTKRDLLQSSFSPMHRIAPTMLTQPS